VSELFATLGISAWKPLLTALVLPPLPFLMLIVAGSRPAASRHRTHRCLFALGLAGVWLSACSGCGRWLTQVALQPPPALGAAQIGALAARAREGASRVPAIVVLGGGREAYAPEYALPDLKPHTLARLRYGLWLARRTGAPVGFSGGIGWAQPDGVPEAEIAARVAATEFGQPLAWTESLSRDTRGNAIGTVARLQRSHIAEAVIVTHAWHMPRALRRFEAAAQGSIRFVAAPIGSGRADSAAFEWVPTSDGTELVRNAVREIFARAAGD
jgi:uncharacterized SAM-binding protein YcdF (DUF218 family)